MYLWEALESVGVEIHVLVSTGAPPVLEKREARNLFNWSEIIEDTDHPQISTENGILDIDIEGEMVETATKSHFSDNPVLEENEELTAYYHIKGQFALDPEEGGPYNLSTNQQGNDLKVMLDVFGES